ncbi:MAG: hypothetical protein ACYCU0_00935 [Solirubrobacteraceae bacterium]
MSYTVEEGREALRRAVAEAAGEIGAALEALGEAHELLDEHLAERLEDELFRPLRRAYGTAQRTSAELAGSTAPTQGAFGARGAPSHGAKGFIESAVSSAKRADEVLAELQDSMLPVEVGDAELRARLSSVRELLSGVPTAARELVRVLGR